jgi:sulfoxide reductase heme-binding subunit YedZ
MKILGYKLTPLMAVIHLAAISVLIWVVYDAFFNPLVFNPIQTITLMTGRAALIFLLLSFACTPAIILFGWKKAAKYSRALGLYAFLFAAVHLAIFLGLDYGFNFQLLLIEFSEKRYIIIGTAAFIILLALAITSFRYWMKRLGKNWKRLHRFVYLAVPLVVLHFAWVRKGDIFSLQGNVLLPFATGVLVAFLLILRIPAVRKRVVRWRTNLSRSLSRPQPSR